MKLEKKILTFSWIALSVALILFVPKKKIREAQVVFLFKQVLTWLLGATVVQKGLIKYPYREFDKALKTSFSFEYFIYPAICVLFNLHFPKNRSRLLKVGYFLLYPSIITMIEVILERNTQLIKYIKWHWAWTWCSLLSVFYISRKYYLWFFQKNDVG